MINFDLLADILYLIIQRYDSNEEAEDMMNMIEKEENKRIPNETDDPIYNNYIVNLVIRNLYRQKGYFEFGISRICKSLSQWKINLDLIYDFIQKRASWNLQSNRSRHLQVNTDLRSNIS